MVTSEQPPANGFVRVARKVYNPMGFAKGYNFVLFFIFAGALMGFTLARLQFLSFYGVFCGPGFGANDRAAPGECYYYMRADYERIGIILHLGTVLPAAFLVCFQFLPVIRHRAILVHRVNGYAILLLALISVAGALMIARRAFGGTQSTQVLIGVLAIVFVGSLTMALINIKRLQIEEHRAWMLRAWFYACSIITLRIIMFLAALIVTNIGGYWSVQACDKLDSIIGNSTKTLEEYPGCAPYYSGQNLDQETAVLAVMGSPRVEQITAALNSNFGAAGWLAFALHAIGVEIYLRLTPKETERLRNVSYQRQLEAGMKNPGSAGLTVDRFGDADKWMPKAASVGSPNGDKLEAKNAELAPKA